MVDAAIMVVGMAHTRLERSNLTKMVDVAVELVGMAMMMRAVNAKKPADVITNAEKLLKMENATKRAREKRVLMCVLRGGSVSRIMSKCV